MVGVESFPSVNEPGVCLVLAIQDVKDIAPLSKKHSLFQGFVSWDP